jgi:hypothetical protein
MPRRLDGGSRRTCGGYQEASVNKQELIAKIAGDTGLTKVATAVESLLDGIRSR